MLRSPANTEMNKRGFCRFPVPLHPLVVKLVPWARQFGLYNKGTRISPMIKNLADGQKRGSSIWRMKGLKISRMIIGEVIRSV